jgi:hypothetical protein
MISKAKFVEEIVVKDPDTGNLIEVEVYKHENGGMFAIDSSYLDQVAGGPPDEEESTDTAIPDPFAKFGEPTVLYLLED